MATIRLPGIVGIFGELTGHVGLLRVALLRTDREHLTSVRHVNGVLGRRQARPGIYHRSACTGGKRNASQNEKGKYEWKT